MFVSGTQHCLRYMARALNYILTKVMEIFGIYIANFSFFFIRSIKTKFHPYHLFQQIPMYTKTVEFFSCWNLIYERAGIIWNDNTNFGTNQNLLKKMGWVEFSLFFWCYRYKNRLFFTWPLTRIVGWYTTNCQKLGNCFII